MTRVDDKITGSVPVRERVVCHRDIDRLSSARTHCRVFVSACSDKNERKKEESSFSYSPDFLQVSFLYQHLLLFLLLPLLVFPPRSRTLFREANQDE